MAFISKYKRDIIAVFIFFLLTLILTYPVIFQFNKAIPIAGGDVYQVAAKINDQAQIFGQEGFFGGLTQIYSEGKLNMNTAAGFCVHSGIPLIATYNLFFLFSFFASALGAYFLAYYFIRNRSAAFLAGIIFAFAPFHHYQALTGHYGTMHQEWLPFFVLFLWKWFDQQKIVFAALSFLFLSIIAITEHHLLASTVLFIALFVAYQIFNAWKIQGIEIPWKKLAILTSGLFFIIAIFYISYVKIATSDENYLNPGLSQVERYSMPLLDPLITPPWHTFWPEVRTTLTSAVEKYTPFHQKNIGEGNSSEYFGYTTIFLFAFVLFLRWHSKRKLILSEIKIWLFWLLVALVFFVASLGPLVAIGAQHIRAPYYLVYKFVPFFENIRTVDRFFVYTLLGIALLTAFSLKWLQTKLTKNSSEIMTTIFAGIIILEFLQIPIGTTTLAYSSFYNQLAKEPGNFRILEIPGSTNYDYGSFLRYTNSIHHKESLSGIVTGRELPGQFNLQKNTPIISTLLYDLPRNKKIAEQDDFQKANEILNQNNIRYITVSKRYFKNSQLRDNTIAFIQKWITPDIFYDDKSLTVFKVPAQSN